VRSRGGLAPITVQGPLRAGDALLPPNSSSQYASALLLALPFLEGASTLTLQEPVHSRPYVDLTVQLMQRAGLRVESESAATQRRFLVPGSQSPRLGAYRVEGDWSSAAFLLAAAAVTQGKVTVVGLDPRSAQGDLAILRHLEAFGAKVTAGDKVEVQGATLESPGTVDVTDTPDLFPLLAAVAACSKGTTTFTGGHQLRAKESDRIAAMQEGLSMMGIECRQRADGLIIQGGVPRGARLRSHGDHRIHMALTIAALAAQGPSRLDDAGVAAVSFPGFHEAIQTLRGAA
jgi:3-phosphoshikimate 1-carboxyvinyltransferase